MYSLSQVVCQNGDMVYNCGITWRRMNEYSTCHPPFIKKTQYCFIIALVNLSNGHLRNSLQREWTSDFGLKICIIYCAKIYVSLCTLNY